MLEQQNQLKRMRLDSFKPFVILSHINQETGFATPKIILHGCCGFIKKEKRLTGLH
jgi:hypothetical protein